MVSQFVPPSRLNCHVPRLASTAVIAIASDATPSGSPMLPSTTSAATVTPDGFVAPSSTLPSVGLALPSSTGASLTSVTVTESSWKSSPPAPSETRTTR